MMPLRAESFDVDGATASYQMTGGSGRPTFSRFCPICGSPLIRQSVRMADYVYVHAASLDDPAGYRPGNSIYTDAAQDWDRPETGS